LEVNAEFVDSLSCSTRFPPVNSLDIINPARTFLNQADKQNITTLQVHPSLEAVPFQLLHLASVQHH